MSAIAFDSLMFAKRLKEAGFTTKQAEVLAEEQQEIIDNNLATKQDIKNLEYELKELEQRIMIKVGAMLFAQTGLIIAIVALFLK